MTSDTPVELVRRVMGFDRSRAVKRKTVVRKRQFIQRRLILIIDGPCSRSFIDIITLRIPIVCLGTRRLRRHRSVDSAAEQSGVRNELNGNCYWRHAIIIITQTHARQKQPEPLVWESDIIVLPDVIRRMRYYNTITIILQYKMELLDVLTCDKLVIRKQK